MSRVISIKTLRQFWNTHPDAEKPLRLWLQITEASEWNNPADLKLSFRSADVLKNSRAIFDIGGNKYGLIAVVLCGKGRVYVRFVGTHEEYDRVDPNTV